jgi:integrase
VRSKPTRHRQLEGLPAISLHGLRQHPPEPLIEDGVDIKTMSERLGHDSIPTTLDIYSHITSKLRTNAATRFGSLLAESRERPLENVTRL